MKKKIQSILHKYIRKDLCVSGWRGTCVIFFSKSYHRAGIKRGCQPNRQSIGVQLIPGTRPRVIPEMVVADNTWTRGTWRTTLTFVDVMSPTRDNVHLVLSQTSVPSAMYENTRGIGNGIGQGRLIPLISVIFFLQLEFNVSKTIFRNASSLRQFECSSAPYGQELYHGVVRPTNNSCYYQQAIYKEEEQDYVAPYPVYAPILGKVFEQTLEKFKVLRKLFILVYDPMQLKTYSFISKRTQGIILLQTMQCCTFRFCN